MNGSGRNVPPRLLLADADGPALGQSDGAVATPGHSFVATAELKRAFATSPMADHAAMRAEIDTLLGEDRLSG